MKNIVWLGGSHKDLLAFPKLVKQEVGYNLDRLQNGLEPIDWKPMPIIGKGVREIRVHAVNEYRVLYLEKQNKKIHVLHVFQKKTQKTRQMDIEIARKRMKLII